MTTWTVERHLYEVDATAAELKIDEGSLIFVDGIGNLILAFAPGQWTSVRPKDAA